MRKMNLLIVEDESSIREIISTYAGKEGYTVYEAEDGKRCYDLLYERDYHMIILDVMLPDTDGWTILRRIRKELQVPVIMLTARSEEDDKLLGFELGADDYVTKPFSAKELMARIRSVLKRNQSILMGDIIQLDELTIQTSYHQVLMNQEEIPLSPLEYDLLMYLVENKNQALTRDQILNGVWGYDYYGDERTVDTHIKRLRQKIGDDGTRIKTIRGVGYRMVMT